MFVVSRCRRSISIIILIAFAMTSFVPPSAAQAIGGLPTPGTMVSLSAPFMPAVIKGLVVHPDNPLRFDFIVDNGDMALSGDSLKDESNKLIKYFLASLTILKDELWVNLSPYEKERMIPEALSKTGLGQDLLAQDYLLKQLTASLMYPENELGAAFWEKVYAQAKEKFGTTEIPLDTFNKVWIIPESASVYEHENTVYVVGAKLKVMLETDYKALQESREWKGENRKSNETVKPSSILDSQLSILREIIIPAIEKEVNEGKNFAPLRQIYYSLILAKWYKETVRNSILSNVYVDKSKVAGIDINDPLAKEKIYDQYMAAYKKGVYNYIKEEYDPATNDVVQQKYFSGGFSDSAMLIIREKEGPAVDVSDASQVTVDLRQVKPGAGDAIALKNRKVVDSAMLDVKNTRAVERFIKRAASLALPAMISEPQVVAMLNTIAEDDMPKIAQALIALGQTEKDRRDGEPLMTAELIADVLWQTPLGKETAAATVKALAGINDARVRFGYGKAVTTARLVDVVFSCTGEAASENTRRAFELARMVMTVGLLDTDEQWNAFTTLLTLRRYDDTSYDPYVWGEDMYAVLYRFFEKIARADDVAKDVLSIEIISALVMAADMGTIRDVLDALYGFAQLAARKDVRMSVPVIAAVIRNAGGFAVLGLDSLEELEVQIAQKKMSHLVPTAGLQALLVGRKGEGVIEVLDTTTAALDRIKTYNDWMDHVKAFAQEPDMKQKAEEPGGIDMNDITVDRNGDGAPIEFDAAVMQNIIEQDVAGFMPIIINITPLPSIMPLLGLNKAPAVPDESEQNPAQLSWIEKIEQWLYKPSRQQVAL